jgi:hypothetical protein
VPSATPPLDKTIASCPSPVLRKQDVQVILKEGSDGRTLMLDLAGVECLTADGLGGLVALHNGLRASGGGLVLWNVGERAYEVFAVAVALMLARFPTEGRVRSWVERQTEALSRMRQEQ